MKKLITITSVIATSLLFGCAGKGNTYKEFRKADQVGYKDRKIDDNKYWVSYTGSKYSEVEDIKSFWDMRAQELCPQGYDTNKVIAERVVDYSNNYIAGTNRSPGANANDERVGKVPVVKGTITCK